MVQRRETQIYSLVGVKGLEEQSGPDLELRLVRIWLGRGKGRAGRLNNRDADIVLFLRLVENVWSPLSKIVTQ